MQGMCTRFMRAAADLRLSKAELARALGYSNAATLAKLERGAAFVDVERLARLALLRSPSGKKVDLHWVITGEEFRREDHDILR